MVESVDSTKRVFIWTYPRSLGTAFLKCMSFVDSIQIINEPYVSAHHYGPEATTLPEELSEFTEKAAKVQVDLGLQNAFDDSVVTYAWVKDRLEAEYPGKNIILVKDQSYCLNGKYNMLPSGYRYAFLIRHPYKVLPSFKKLCTDVLQLDYDTTSWQDDLAPRGAPINCYEDQYNIYQFIKENIEPNPIIFDADDIQRHPASILSQFCQHFGIPYSDNLLEWDSGRDVIKTWVASKTTLQGNLLEGSGGFFETALQSTKFLPGRETPSKSSLPKDVQEIADLCMPFYEKMHELKIKP